MKVLIKFIFVLFCLSYTCIGCDDFNENYWNERFDELENSQYTTDILFSTGDLYPAFKIRTKEYSVSSLNCLNPFYITVKTNPQNKVEINGKIAKANEPFKIKLDKLDWTNYIMVRIGEQEYKIRTIHENYPRYIVYSDHPKPGNIYMANNMLPLSILSSEGNLLYYRMGAYTFFYKTYNSKQEIRYVALKLYSTPLLQGAGYGQGKILILDGDFNVIREITPYNTQSSGELYNESHDFMYLDDDHYIFSLYTPKIVYNIPEDIPQNPFGSQVVATHLQEVKDGKVVWEWFSTDFPQFYRSSLEGNDYRNITEQWADYMHFNSMFLDPTDNNLVCSFRRQCAIMKIDRTTGKIRWILGGKDDEFGLTTEQKMKFQHYAEIFHNNDESKTVTAYDNRTGEVYSRIVEYTIDEINKKLLSFKEQVGPYYGRYSGSVQKRNDSYFIGWGGGASFSGCASITEMSTDGQKIFFNLFLPQNVSVYRALKSE